MDYDAVLKPYRKKSIATLEQMPTRFEYPRAAIEKIIPHRDPFLLVDQLNGLDLDQAVLIASRQIIESDPVFQGHFPGAPVYPGALQVEMIGQAGLCLSYFVNSQRTTISDQARPVSVRATKILGAYFLEPVLPGQEVSLVVKRLAHETYFASVIGQVISGQKICTVAICEVCFVD
jgi:3-hydroxymyristoyl/3-hydroxydecanoyl-(acyl carrier protein) dehydratase